LIQMWIHVDEHEKLEDLERRIAALEQERGVRDND
jgi:hypothetical protein